MRPLQLAFKAIEQQSAGNHRGTASHERARIKPVSLILSNARVNGKHVLKVTISQSPVDSLNPFGSTQARDRHLSTIKSILFTKKDKTPPAFSRVLARKSSYDTPFNQTLVVVK